MQTLPRRDFVKLALAGAFALAQGGCALRRAGSPIEPPTDAAALSDLQAALRRALTQCVERGDVPGAVALVQVNGVTLFHEAFGHACNTPECQTPMRTDHVFDLASLTKVVGATTSILSLRDAGRLTLDDKLSAHLPQLASSDKKDLTIRQCLTHTAGLPPFRQYYKTLRGREAYLQAIAAEPLQSAPGARWVYSDLGFILLGLVAESASGMPLDKYVASRIIAPLGMPLTGYWPIPLDVEAFPDDLKTLTTQFAATEHCAWRGRLMAGQVHDENAYAMGGVSGHAGLFGTTAALARFGQMMLNKGERTDTGAQILSPESVSMINRPQIPTVNPFQGLGWRLRASLESPIGFLGSPRAFGHTGFTGTSLWIDPDHQAVVVLLTNAVHPDRAKARSAPVRLAVHDTVVKQLHQAPERVLTGLDVLEAEGFARLRGKRVAVVTNQTAINREGKPLLDLLATQPDVRVTAIFSPEHGFMGEAAAGARIGDSKHGAIPVFSLYGARRKPAPEMANLFDVVLFDIQDVGARFYTYIWTLFSVQEFCAESGKPLIVLDRPNPLGGVHVEGPQLEPPFATFVGLKPIPTRYGLTSGELATLFNQQNWLASGRPAPLEVVAMQGWRRTMRFHQTGLPWIAPSPNMPTWDTAAVYPGTCIFEGTRWSEGRGTAVPFEMVGGPGIDSQSLARELNALALPGCRFLPADFTPRATPAAPDCKHRDQRCGGVFIRVDNHETFLPVKTGLAVLMALRAQAPGAHKWIPTHFDRLLGTGEVRKAIEAGAALDRIASAWNQGVEAFEPIRRKAMLYA